MRRRGPGRDAVPTSAAPSSSAAAASPSASSSASASGSPSAAAVQRGAERPERRHLRRPRRRRRVLDDADFVVTQPTKGTYKAFSKICTHAGCPVTKVEDGVIKCPCHGSQFSIEDGSVKNPPASKPLAESATTVAGSKVYVTG